MNRPSTSASTSGKPQRPATGKSTASARSSAPASLDVMVAQLSTGSVLARQHAVRARCKGESCNFHHRAFHLTPAQAQESWRPSQMQRHGLAVFPSASGAAHSALAMVVQGADQHGSPATAASSPAALASPSTRPLTPATSSWSRPATSAGERQRQWQRRPRPCIADLSSRVRRQAVPTADIWHHADTGRRDFAVMPRGRLVGRAHRLRHQAAQVPSSASKYGPEPLTNVLDAVPNHVS
jgi:hypothetical protein